MSLPDAQLEELTPADREILDKQLHKKLMTSTAAFVPLILIAFGVIFYLNSTSGHGLETDTITVINVVLVLAGMLAGRLYVGHVINFFKDKNAIHKKVYRGVITAKENGMVQINSHELEIGRPHYDMLEKGMRAEIHLSIKSGLVIAIKRGK
jgi:hypothetical protein